jgi:hypothetical protein
LDKEYHYITSDLTIQATYDVNMYTVRFLDDDGTGLKSVSVEYLSSAIRQAILKKTNIALLAGIKVLMRLQKASILWLSMNQPMSPLPTIPQVGLRLPCRAFLWRSDSASNNH